MATRSTQDTATRAAGRVILATHAVLVALVAAYIVLSAATAGLGADLGVALGLLGAGLLAAPWSLLILLDAHFTVDSAPFVALAAAGALGNLALHAMLWSRWSGRRHAS